jgi:integrase
MPPRVPPPSSSATRRPPSRHLVHAAVKPATQQRYRSHVLWLVAWAHDNDYSDEDITDAQQLDELLCVFIHHLYDSSYGRHNASLTLYGILSYLPGLKDQLPISKRAMVGWQKKHPPTPWPPITLPVAAAVAVRMACNGSVRAGIGCLLAFDCLLRCNELLGLHARDVCEEGDGRVGAGFTGMWLRLRTTKTGNEFSVQVLHPQLRLLVRELVRRTAPDNLLFDYSATTFRSYFKRACAELRCSSDLVVHSLRHGGATHLYAERGWSVGDIAQHGRWASEESARHYLQTCRAMLTARAAEPAVALGRILLLDLPRSFSLALPQRHS